MKKGMAWLFAALLLMTQRAGLASAVFEVEVKNPDAFYAQHRETALPIDQSPNFDVYFRIFDADESFRSDEDMPVDEDGWGIVLQFLLINKTDRRFPDLMLIPHFAEDMQAMMKFPVLYQEPITIEPKGGETPPYALESTWSTFLDLVAIGMIGDLSVETLYDICLEVNWRGGGEVIQLDASRAMAWPSDEPEEPEGDAPYRSASGLSLIDEETVARIVERGIEQRIKAFGE